MQSEITTPSIIDITPSEIDSVNGGSRLAAARLVYATVKMGVESVYNLAKAAGEAMTKTTD